MCGSISIQDLDMWVLLLSNVVKARKKIGKGVFLSQDKIFTFNSREGLGIYSEPLLQNGITF